MSNVKWPLTRDGGFHAVLADPHSAERSSSLCRGCGVSEVGATSVDLMRGGSFPVHAVRLA
jgi:hypothetical protein